MQDQAGSQTIVVSVGHDVTGPRAVFRQQLVASGVSVCAGPRRVHHVLGRGSEFHQFKYSGLTRFREARAVNLRVVEARN